MQLPKHRIPPEIVENAYRRLFEAMKALYPLSEEVLELFHHRSVPVLYKPKEIILNYGELCNYCLFALKGLVKSTFIVGGAEKIVWFMRGGDAIVGVHSWFDQEQSEEKITAIKETLCIAISWSDVQQLKKDRPDFLAFVLKLTERHYVLAIQRTKWQQFSTDEKIENLYELYPQLMQEVPVKDLASYLGISRETFTSKRRRH
ncbi:Crp/Fnr family transcriptional regulator [Pedobacter sp. KR3-3]|uniref:Crp/Fnr family transcriptional regulator n=1 Tax=Pedobacter albus TaxID=3113905 RepID=A0ABU7IAA4_9SPHI|nr:Crp/Fnr family transcriptional regulator [Pedobacter sp. KR3-3]MEE1946415.1 Crp/Fnr family transcriptional regulator [Pedobacter sp. KR3-3]